VHLAATNQAGGLVGILAASGLDSRNIQKLIALGRTRSQARDLERQWQSFCQGSPSPAEVFRATTDPRTRRNLALLKTILASRADDPFLKRSTDGVLFAAQALGAPMTLRPLFESALDHRQATAWICANDGVALEALPFLEKQGIRVPHDLSVVGFDNLPVRSLEMRLTTLDFNAAGFVHEMLNFISRPGRSQGYVQPPVVEIEGVIVERGTTGTALVD
jgi:hypothetical protein